MHQCVSLAHLGSCSPGCTGLGSSVNVRVVLMRRVRVALVSSDFMRPQSVVARLRLQQTTADRFTVVTSSIVGLKVSVRWRGDYISLIWVKVQVAGQIRELETCTFTPRGLHLLRVRLHTFCYVNALTVHSVDGPIRGRKTKASIGRFQFRARLHQAPFTWSLPFHTQITFTGYISMLHIQI